MKLHSNPLSQIFHISKTIERMLQSNVQKVCGVSHSDAELLVMIGYHPDTTQRELSDFLMVSPPAISRQIDRLEQAGYLTRTESPDSRRSSRMVLTAQGKKMQVRVQKYLETSLQQILDDTGGLSQSTIKNLDTITKKLGTDALCRGKSEHSKK